MQRKLHKISVCFVVFAPFAWAADQVAGNSGSNSVQNAASSQVANSIERARAAFFKGAYEEADRMYQQAIKQAEAARMQNVLLARASYELGAVRKVEGRCGEAAPLIQRGLALLISQSRSGDLHANANEITGVWEALGAARACDYAYTQAEYAYQKALEMEQRAATPRKPVVFEIQSNLGSVYQEEGKYSQAQAAFEAAAALQNDPKIDPLSRAMLAGTYGPLLRSLGRQTEAADMIQSGLAILRAARDPDGGTTVILLNAMALVQSDRKAYAEAAQLLSEALDRMDKGAVFRPDDRAQVLRNYAFCLRKLGEKKLAHRLESQAGQLTAGLRPDATRGALVDVSELALEH